MRNFSIVRIWCCLGVILMNAGAVHAGYLDDIGYSQLKDDLGSGLADGSTVNVTQVEAGTNWIPDLSNPEFLGKTIVDQSIPVSPGISGHATSVAKLFYGSSSSVAPGITSIDVYSATDWVNNILLGNNSSKPLVSSSRVANHSWVGSAVDNFTTSQILRRIDWLVETDEVVQVVGLSNGGVQQPLLGNAYNVIAVSRTDGAHPQGSVAIDSTYPIGRTRPDVAVPQSTTSNAAPVVAATATLLIEAAHQAAERPSEAMTNRNGDVIYNAERSEVLKAAIMAGADRVTNNSTPNDIQGYRAAVVNQSSNGLDNRFGAGQINVFNSYSIIDAGEFDSLEDGGANSGNIGWTGFDYDSSFGGENNSNSTASYFFKTSDSEPVQLFATLAWNLDIDGVNGPVFDGEATLYDLNLALYDVTNNDMTLIESSESAIDSTENIWLELDSGRDYMLQIQTGIGPTFNWDYGLAWRISSSAVPVPAAFWLFGSAMVLLLGCFSIGKTNGAWMRNSVCPIQ